MRRHWLRKIVLAILCGAGSLAAAPVRSEVPFVFDDVTGFDSPSDTAKIQAALQANEPQKSAAAAIARGDFRLILVSTLGPSYIDFDCVLPPSRYSSFVRVQIPVSDVITEGLADFSEAFFAYAKAYNALILSSRAYPDYDICHVGAPHIGRREIDVDDLRKAIADGRSAEQSDLAHAARFGHIGAVRKFIAAGVDLNHPDMFGMTPLVWAIVRGKADIVGMLLDAGADANRFARVDQDRAPIAWAAAGGQPRMIELLLNHGAAIDGNDAQRRGISPLAVAAGRNDEALVDLLLQRGAKVDTGPDADNRTPLSLAVRTGNVTLVERFLAAGANPNFAPSLDDWENDPPPLLAAVQSGKSALVDTLLRAGANPNLTNECGGDGPIQFAAKREDENILVELLRHGGDANAGREKRGRGRYVGPQSKCDAPIYVAVDQRQTNPRALEVLIRAGANLNERNSYNKESALHKAAENGDETSVKILLSHHANPNFRDGDGRTPFFSAVGTYRADAPQGRDAALRVAQQLMSAGAKPELIDENGETPLFLFGACIGEVASFLIAHGVSATHVDNDGQTALWEAVGAGCPELAAVLVKAGVDPDHTDRDGNTAFNTQDSQVGSSRADAVRAAISGIARGRPRKP